MKKKAQVFDSGHIRLVVIGVALLLVVLLIGFIVHWKPSKTIARQQTAFLEAAEKKNAAKMRRLISNQYADRYGFTPTDITESMLDARSQFLILNLASEGESTQIEGRQATVTTKLTMVGTPIGAGTAVMTRANKLDSPFVFTWKKESFLPSSWRLSSIENAAIPDNVWGYRPGSIREAME